MIDETAVPTLPRGVRLHRDRVRDTWVLLAPERTIMLDDIGHAILSRVDGVRSLEAIVTDLAEAFQAPRDVITADAARFLGGLRDRRFVELQ